MAPNAIWSGGTSLPCQLIWLEEPNAESTGGSCCAAALPPFELAVCLTGPKRVRAEQVDISPEFYRRFNRRFFSYRRIKWGM